MTFGARNILAVCLCMALVLTMAGCQQPQPQQVKTVEIPDGSKIQTRT